MLVLHLDAHHLGDPLFVTGLARDLQARGGGSVLVHATGERGERAIESLGHVAVSDGGAWRTPDPEAAAVVEKAGRDLNREIAHELNEAGVASVRVIGADRGLLRPGDGRLGAGKTGWVADLVEQGVVVVVAAFVDGGDAALREVSGLGATAALARALGAPVSLLATKRLRDPTDASREDLLGLLDDSEAVVRLLRDGAEVVVYQRAEIRSDGSGRVLSREGGDQ